MNHKLFSATFFIFFMITAFVIYFYIQTIPIPTVEEMLEDNYNEKVALQQQRIEFGVLEPLQIASIFLGIVFFILIFVSKELFNTWKKFAFIYIPIGLVLIVITPIQSHGFLSLTPDRYDITNFVSYGFLIMSILVLIIKKFFIMKKK